MAADFNIDSRRNLARWLKGKPIEWSSILAERTALRVLPLISGVSESFPHNPKLTLDVFRSVICLRSGSADASAIAATIARSSARTVRVSIEHDPAASAYAAAALNALSAAGSAVIERGGKAIDAASSAAGFSVAAANAAADYSNSDIDDVDAAMWGAIQADCETLKIVGSKDLSSAPLWLTPRLGVIEGFLGRLFDMYQNMGTDWRCLVPWYEVILEAKCEEYSSSIYSELAAVSEDFWERPTDLVISEIAQMLGWDGGDLEEPSDEISRPSIKPIYVPEMRESIEEPQDVAPEILEIEPEDIEERDFFVSYSNKDVRTAKLVSEVLEKAGYSTFAQFKDIKQGANFVGQMNKGLACSKRLISLHSPDYEASEHCQSEWSFAYNEDPNGKRRKLIQFVVRPTSLNALARQVVYRSLIGLPDHKKREEILDAVGYSPPKRSVDEAVKALASQASPDAQLSDDFKLDAGPNAKLDNPLVDVELADLPIIQISVCKVLLQGAPGNASKVVTAALEEYKSHLEQRGANPVVGLLVAHGQSILAEFNGPDAILWEDAGIRQQIDAFSANHDRLITHFPLNADRERLYSETRVDELAASGDALKGPIVSTIEELRPVIDAGMATREFEQTFEDIEQRLELIEASPPSMTSPKENYDRATPRSRFVLQTLGFFASAHSVANSTQTIVKSVQGSAFISALATAISKMKVFLSL